MTATTDTARRFPGLAFLLLAIGFAFVQGTVMAVEMPEIVASLGMTPDSGTFAATIMIAVSGATLITAGRAADRYGRRRVCLTGIVVVMAASAMSALAWNGGIFLAARAAQGLGIALLLTSIGLVGLLFAGAARRDRDLAFGLLGASVGVGLALAPLIAAGALALGSWRWSFWLNLPVLGLAWFGIRRFVPESRAETGDAGIDWPGTVFLAIGMISALFVLTQGFRLGWWRHASGGTAWPLPVSPVPLVILLAAAALAGFVAIESSRQKRSLPVLMDARLFEDRRFTLGCAVSFLFVLGGYALQFMVPVFGRIVLHEDALQVTLLTAAGGVGIAAGGIAAAPLSARYGERFVVIGGLTLATGALALLTLMLDFTLGGAEFAAVLVAFGTGYGLVYARITEVTLAGTPPDSAGLASGLLVAGRTCAMAIGSAALTAIMLARSDGAAPTSAGELHASRIAFGLGLVILLAALATAWAIPRDAGTATARLSRKEHKA